LRDAGVRIVTVPVGMTAVSAEASRSPVRPVADHLSGSRGGRDERCRFCGNGRC